ncbi:polymer-forming cytoskeletal protein [Glaesserella parasuis]|uniref:polymer-forming cytoskeletal protein n=2 Tax=Glaesserella parasuis TaxID=738 RepID=UPI000DD3FC1B|nr:polymer-forming cytoskeletal protein [Glaesserella parasuis]MDG6325689.1 polymer-forming cytoskeletal protein [Glaesserella parasuis]MDO9940175.1 polymer-forming cytoskeletal protein [Glaesserella parasuis]MDO9942252.1 polymer-forming cytoskeletal protein [Glaesserella parasuis]MDP0012409.1 polymer-forming cytoskeletal protein [Glaesserella parasuis]MDP0305567.1 polymer-forming cytoskeletal protein [Glaesserella parasuis]
MTEQTTQKKYELLKDDTVEHFGRTLYRIKALITFGLVGAGQLGGYIETEKNLDHSGNAWVYDNALVYDDARVYGNACVYDDAWVYGDARVYGNAQVYGNARVFGNAWMCGNARVYAKAWVYGDARVFGNALVYGDACVYGDAWVYGNACVYGNARVFGNAWVRSFAVISERKMIFWASNVGSENGTLTVSNGKFGLIVTRGCFTGTVDEFLSKSKEVHDDKTHHEYKLLIEVAQSRILN